jgi:hypothetical protein
VFKFLVLSSHVSFTGIQVFRISGFLEDMAIIPQNVTYDLDTRSPLIPPKFNRAGGLDDWISRFDTYISYTDSSLWGPILTRFEMPLHAAAGNEERRRMLPSELSDA